MQEQHLYEYAVIRVVPQVDREEFLNVGTVLYCAAKKFIGVKFLIDARRITAFSAKADIAELEDYFCAFEKICLGATDSGPIGKLPPAERFRWLTATRSTVVQTSKVHPGLCDEPSVALEKLFEQQVL